MRPAHHDRDVDHTFECQLMGHAVVQSGAWDYMIKQEGFGSGKIEGAALKTSLKEVYDIQNSMENLHMMDSGFNASKGQLCKTGWNRVELK